MSDIRHVLYISNDEDFAIGLGFALYEYNYELSAFASGHEALATLAAWVEPTGLIDALIIDNDMDDMSALGVAAKLPSWAQGIPRIVLSGDDHMSPGLQALSQAQHIHVLRKPFTLDHLIQAMNTVVPNAQTLPIPGEG